MKDKVIIVGQMGTGKTTIAEKLSQEYGHVQVALATSVKEVERKLWGFQEKKNRTRLQQIGCKMREIDKDVWIKSIMNKIQVLEGLYGFNRFVIDDVRFLNEFYYFLDKGWAVIGLNTPIKIRRPRLEKAYGKVTEKQLNDVSETEVLKILQAKSVSVINEYLGMQVEKKWEKAERILNGR